MEDQHRSKFRPIELIVLVIVVGMLLALLLPAVNQDRPGRRATCMNNQKEITLALLGHESAHGHFPGYANRVGPEDADQHLVTSWVVPSLPFLWREDLWKAWKDGKQVKVELNVLLCPKDSSVDSAPGAAPLSYVVNCGKPGDDDTLADGLFFNHDVDAEPVLQSLDYLSAHDGSANTLILSENIQAGRWTDVSEADVGMVWRDVPIKDSRINQGKDAGDRPGDIRYARPSSNHPGIVIVSFCDGRVRSLSEEIDYRVYQHVMTPNGKEAGLQGEFDPANF